jgi:hypothetical protein
MLSLALLLLSFSVINAFDPTPYEINIAFVEYASDDYFAPTSPSRPVKEREFLQFFVDKWNQNRTFFPDNNVTIKLRFTPACFSRNVGTSRRNNYRPG